MTREDPDLASMTLNDIMNRWPQTVAVFLRHRMLCVGCGIGPFHTVRDACEIYDLDEAGFEGELFRAISAARPVRPG